VTVVFTATVVALGLKLLSFTSMLLEVLPVEPVLPVAPVAPVLPGAAESLPPHAAARISAAIKPL
jgi:hypothetical protein